MKIKSICRVCKKSFLYYPGARVGKYCSHACLKKDRSTVTRESYTPELKQKKRELAVHYWQKVRAGEIHRVFKEKPIKNHTIGRPRIIKNIKLFVCGHCGRKFKSDLADNKGMYCSLSCYRMHKQQNASHYRIKAFAHLPHECALCGETKDPLIVHHKDEDHYNHSLTNLQILCGFCHTSLHKEKAKAGLTLPFKEGKAVRAIRDLLDSFRLDLSDPNLKDTPMRMLRSYYEIFDGLFELKEKTASLLNFAFPSSYSGIVIQSPIKCYSMCPHHFLPVIYTVSLGYMSDKKALGLSKLSRIAMLLAKRPVLQEDYTEDLCETLYKGLKARGTIVIVKGEHLCMEMRGVQKESPTITSSVRGCFTDLSIKTEFLSLIKSI